jgi:diguanylate cyclase (GGDEF)-like protein/PAS domain S-box-containing protein
MTAPRPACHHAATVAKDTMSESIEQRLARIERLIDAIDLPIGRWDELHRLIYCNKPYETWANRPREELLGRTLAQIYGDAAWARARDAFAQAFAGRAVSYERQLTHRGAPVRWARIQVFPEREADGRIDSVFTIAFDIHNDVVEREALRAARRRLDRFAENIPYPLTYIDRNCTLHFVNKAYVLAANQPAEELLGRHIGEVRGARRWAEHRPYFERALGGEAVQYTRLVETPTHGQRWLRTSYVPDFDDAGNVVGAYTVTVDVHELTVAQEKLRRSVERDAVTDALSRRTMMDRIDLAAAQAESAPVALFFVDLDGFKGVNDTLGHREGDQLLVEVARALGATVRADDSVGRFGGDEFLVLAAVRDVAGAETLAQHLLQAVQQASAALPSPVSASIGYALAPSDTTQALKLLQLADDAMYCAKRLGKNRALHCGALKP